MTVTPLYAGLLALWYFWLSMRISNYRGHGISLGDGGDPRLQRLIRAHANFGEYVPLILLMLGLLELGHFSIYLLHALGLTLLAARLLHGIALSFSEGWVFGRYWGTALSYFLLVFCGISCLYQALQAHWLWCCVR
jgi:uncharacterized membrane protein YecN with MAPEG domain